ncbi:GNAT family N-acetyltransferase [Actinomadura madurae]|nr:GNAT family N-acetyltransferase [Actinomadura madurae]MCP9968847.1 GNAT family N-acetyltransferase [Actinomadura madurae]MCQ0017521.1 GNAT family N-acetyltransferase [Actinomadura madurae]
MGAYVTAVWGWDEEVQRGFHSRSFDPGRWQIVTADGADVGMLAVDHRPTEIYLGRIELLPAHQGRGIGTELITVLLDQAGPAGQGSDPGRPDRQPPRPRPLPAPRPAGGGPARRRRHQDQDALHPAQAQRQLTLRRSVADRLLVEAGGQGDEHDEDDGDPEQ